jgi:hypothetical protein
MVGPNTFAKFEAGIFTAGTSATLIMNKQK